MDMGNNAMYLKFRVVCNFFKQFLFLIVNFFIDGILFFWHSMVFFQNTFSKIESRIILHYHSIEKGLLHEKLKLRFGEKVVIDLIRLLKIDEVKANYKQTQISSAYLAVCKYYEIHQDNNCDISDFFSESDFNYFKSLSTLDSNCILHNRKNIFYKNTNDNFLYFSKSRKSIRNFTGEKIPYTTIEQAIDIAKTAPSVCNRQPTKVYYLEDKNTIEKVFNIQKGLKGYTENIFQLLIVVSDRNYFYKIGERNQLYIDGGIFLMNLLYALHFYKIGACPAHWGLNFKQDKEIKSIIGLKKSEKVICLVPIGIPENEFKTTLSLRRSTEEILKKINIV